MYVDGVLTILPVTSAEEPSSAIADALVGRICGTVAGVNSCAVHSTPESAWLSVVSGGMRLPADLRADIVP
jgi:hypothetical protein